MGKRKQPLMGLSKEIPIEWKKTWKITYQLKFVSKTNSSFENQSFDQSMIMLVVCVRSDCLVQFVELCSNNEHGIDVHTWEIERKRERARTNTPKSIGQSSIIYVIRHANITHTKKKPQQLLQYTTKKPFLIWEYSFFVQSKFLIQANQQRIQRISLVFVCLFLVVSWLLLSVGWFCRLFQIHTIFLLR